ncbi:extracellular solute-binding protein [Mycoplasmatota bacterium WC30]
MKKILLLLFTMFLTTAFTACGGETDEPEAIDTLILYSNQVSGGRGARLQTMISDAGFEFSVEIVELSAQNLKNRLVAEKAAPIADVVLGGGMLEHLALKSEGVTKPFFPTWLNKIDGALLDDEGYYSPWSIEPLLLVYNKAHYTDDDNLVSSSLKKAPTDYQDLADNFVGEYNVFKPSSGTGATIYASVLLDYRDTSGDIGIGQEGWDLLDSLLNGGEIDRGLWQMNLAGSEKPISMTWAGAIIEIEAAYGIELGIVEPEAGVPYVVSQVAVINSGNSAREAAAKQFVEWWGQTATQVAWSAISGQAPANRDAFDLVDEQVQEISNINAIQLDWEFIVENISDWRQKIELDIIRN